MPSDRPRRKLVAVYLSPEESVAVQRAADAEGASVSGLMRGLLQRYVPAGKGPLRARVALLEERIQAIEDKKRAEYTTRHHGWEEGQV